MELVTPWHLAVSAAHLTAPEVLFATNQDISRLNPQQPSAEELDRRLRPTGEREQQAHLLAAAVSAA